MTERLISACGLVCSECDAFLATQAGDAAAIERVAAQWSEQFGATIPAAGVWCDGCMTGGERRCGHVDECKIRACVVGRSLANCAGCTTTCAACSRSSSGSPRSRARGRRSSRCAPDREPPVTTLVALLRAVNVSGQNRVPMAELRVALESAGVRSAETYVQSGNVVFDADGDSASAQAATVHDAIETAFGHDVAVIALTAAELADVAGGNPFLAAEGADTASDVASAAAAPGVDAKTLHVTFLERPVEEAAFRDLQLPVAPGEAAALAPGGGCIYLHLPHGYGGTRLSNAWFERALRVRATTRNWRTVLALAGMSARD